MTVYITPAAADAIVEAAGFYYRDRGLMLSALGAPMPVFGEEVYLDLHAKAAALIIAINRNHPMIEGNKRTSWYLVTFFYAENGWDLSADTDDAEAFLKWIADEHTELVHAADWLAGHAVPLGE